jgi:hypothetical protein
LGGSGAVEFEIRGERALKELVHMLERSSNRARV